MAPRVFLFLILPYRVLAARVRCVVLRVTQAKISGARFSVLSGQVARLERAIVQFFLDEHTCVSCLSMLSMRPLRHFS